MNKTTKENKPVTFRLTPCCLKILKDISKQKNMYQAQVIGIWAEETLRKERIKLYD